MAESKEVLLEVKLDLKDAKTEQFKKNWVNWVKCYVRIEAIECFPCYLKISFFNEDDQHHDCPFSIIRLNIPGVRVGSAASRTKSFTYGLFWKSNRRRCRLFLAFPDKQSSVRHMEWLKKAIDGLELYRKRILENHRISRSILNETASSCNSMFETKQLSDNTKNSLNDTQTERDMNDVLGPLPDIPDSAAECSRWSVRRASGCSGIYEEILDPEQSTDSANEKVTRESVVSGIYVDMRTPIQPIGNENAEVPPPLPPRRRHKNHVYTAIDLQTDGNTKSRKSSWNIKNVFGRTKTVEKLVQDENIKLSNMPKSRSENGQINLLASSKNSFSSPDLITIVEDDSKQSTASNRNEIDETDLEVMDIERSNSLNCSANQFLCRPPSLNISANILWSHNLSSTLSSTCDPSAINLIGANVNSFQSFLAQDLSGYCKMVPIIKRSTEIPITSTAHKKPFERSSSTLNTDSFKFEVFDISSDYCPMAPILNQNISEAEAKAAELTKNITFERKFDISEDNQSAFNFSLNSVDKSGSKRASSIDSSSGISSDEGHSQYARAFSPMVSDSIEVKPNCQLATASDDAISLTYTESPPQSANIQRTDTSFLFHSTKFDEKYPSYFPNDSIGASDDANVQSNTSKYTVNDKNVKILPKTRRKSCSDKNYSHKKQMQTNETDDIKLNRQQHHQHINTIPKSNHKTTAKPQTPHKVQKSKQRKHSVPEILAKFDDNLRSTATCSNENWCSKANIEMCSTQADDRTYKRLPTVHMSSPVDAKTVLSHLDPNTKFDLLRPISKVPHRPANHYGYEKNSKSIKITSSPRRIYNKCATLATRLKTPPSTPTETIPKCMTLKARTNGPGKSGSDCQISSIGASESTSSGGLMRFASLTRLRKIDFSPLKLKINSILQRSNNEF